MKVILNNGEKTTRVVHKTIDGVVTVLPKAKDVSCIETDSLFITLSEEGKKMWDNGEEITKEFFSCYMDKKGLERCQF